MMMSRKAEERNEKIIRGLMKLPPNRRCINCNTLGPQYVCTNFWTFVCMICSGIHREFTHRVKSVSMSKFTAQEVEALQRGGNQRARETFLIDWDPQRQKFPNGSDADKVREFIKNVYVDRRYAAGKTSEKPPRILQDHKSHGDLTRRASSYHSYSQSPPYDYQYEERRYGKQAFTLIRKAGSDRGLKTSGSFSPSRLADPVNEENFANESSNSRSSNYSTSTSSSSGSPYRSINQAPTTQKGIKFSSTSSETLRERVDLWNQKVNTFSDTNTNLDKVKAPHSQRTASDSSSASFSSSSMSFNSLNSENAYGPEKASGTPCKLTTFLSLPSSSVSGNYDSPELFDTVFASQTVTSSTSDSDLFRSPELSSNLPIDLFQPSFMSSISTASCQELSLASQPLFSDQKQSVATLNETSLDLVNQQNHRWATFDGPQNMPSQGSQSCTGAAIPEGSSVSNANQHLFQNITRQWSAFHDSSAQATYPSMPIQWHGSPHNNVALPSSSNQQSWNAYESCVGQLSLESIYQQSSQHITGTNPSLIANQYLDLRVQEGIYKDGMPSASIETGPSIHSIQSYTMAGVSSKTNRRSTNPFDIAYESDLVPNNMLLDMDSMQGVLPNIKLPTAFSDGVTDPWFARNSETLYVPTGPQGALGLFGGPVPSTQLMGVPSQGPVAPVGGNPFA